MTGMMIHVAVFTGLLAPLYVLFLRSLRHLSRQKSEAASGIPGVLHRGDMRG